ncbi:MAG TPA: hypothetical protein VFM68_02140 [Candidatus Saccharimonadales bacterium]|nr:hypothetical protein [Candidatus Saccharimonadales bacterium]
MSHKFHPHHITFTPVDPLGDGLREEIIAEQSESDAIVLEERPDEGELSHYWQSVESDIHQDPEWFTFTED